MINFCLVDPRTTHPTRGTAFSCGWDLYFPETKILLAGAKLRVDLMVQVFMPAQTMGLLALRSSVAMNYDISISGGIIGGRRKIVITKRGLIRFLFSQIAITPVRSG
jgi:dUTPase